MKKMVAIAVCVLGAWVSLAESLVVEGQVMTFNDGKTWKIVDPNRVKMTLANVALDIGAEVSEYKGKIVRVTGEKHPERTWPTFITIEKIEVVDE